MLFDPLTPENLIFPITYNNADVRAVAVTIDHGKSPAALSVATIFS
jgi:hypothetical protein